MSSINLAVSIILVITLSIIIMILSPKLNEFDTSIYKKNTPHLYQVSQINNLMRESLQQILLASYHDPSLEISKKHERKHKVTKHLNKVLKNIKKTTVLWNKDLKKGLSSKEKKILNEYTSLTDDFIKKGLLKAIELFKKNKYNKAQHHIDQTIIPAFNKASNKGKSFLNYHNHNETLKFL